jgi:hypothetical protein
MLQGDAGHRPGALWGITRNIERRMIDANDIIKSTITSSEAAK